MNGKRERLTVPRVIPRGIYLLPSMLTLANILCGFYSIISVINHYRAPSPANYFARAALFIFAAAVFDLLDGRIARLTHSSSAFGGQLDSLADIVSFGLAPGILAYSWALEDYQRLGWIPAFLFLGCGSIRLARFNVLEEDKEFKSSRFFIGLPIPAAAATIATAVLLKPDVERKSFVSFLALFSVYALSYLMVSRFRYRSFKDVDWTRKRPLGTFFFIVLILIVILHDPELMFFLLAVSYAMSGVIAFFLPEASLKFFRKLDQMFLDVKILDDADTAMTAPADEDAAGEIMEEKTSKDLEKEDVNE